MLTSCISAEDKFGVWAWGTSGIPAEHASCLSPAQALNSIFQPTFEKRSCESPARSKDAKLNQDSSERLGRLVSLLTFLSNDDACQQSDVACIKVNMMCCRPSNSNDASRHGIRVFVRIAEPFPCATGKIKYKTDAACHCARGCRIEDFSSEVKVHT